MSTSPISPEDIRAAAEVHQELGPEYSDAVVAVFVDKVEREVCARVEARLAEASRGRLARRGGRRTLVTGVAIGACAGALITGITLAHLDHSDPALPGGQAAPVHLRFVPPGQVGKIMLKDGREVSISLPNGQHIPLPDAPSE